jgi:hypothetical protein
MEFQVTRDNFDRMCASAHCGSIAFYHVYADSGLGVNYAHGFHTCREHLTDAMDMVEDMIFADIRDFGKARAA